MHAASPNKIENDAIVEALLEIRFDSDDLGPIVIGRLSDSALWNGYTSQTLSASNIPDNIRENDLGLRFQPLIERRSQDNTSNFRVGNHVLSYHVYSPYPGWKEFNPKLVSIIEDLFNKTTNLRITRLGFRYINYLQSSKHHIDTPEDLALDIHLQDTPIVNGFNFSHLKTVTNIHQVLTRTASADFLNAQEKPDDLVCVADVDVFTPNGFINDNKDSVIKWLLEAHKIEKKAFFSLFHKETIDKLESNE